ncbi:vasculin-like protein 1 [Rhipicephalus sanguineus]|uniref:vasculin-like protein 1 n=1 Tax=Rhipicephalus sanguineus TaxID=34632 RepID=UPI0020C23242|nr:vasculin-like protein 1 [Rhipicephalus sanguineus]
MANHQQQPAHDFAPSWLKIPTYDTAKNSDAPHHHARSDEHRLGFHRRSGASLRSGFHGDGFRERDPGGRQSPLGDSRGVPFSSRHASADAEDRLFHHSVPSSGVHKVAQPPRRPHSRHDFRDFLQPSYHKMSSSAVQSSDNCANIVGAQVGGSAVVTQRSKKDLPGNNFNQEFPTLQGADEAPVQQPPVVNGSVWENPRNSKVHGTVLKKVHLTQRPSPRTEPASLLEVRSKSPNFHLRFDTFDPYLICCVPYINPCFISVENGLFAVSACVGTELCVLPSVVSAVGALSPKLGRPANLTGPSPAIKTVSASQNSLYKALLPSNKKSQVGHAMEILVKHPKTKGNKGDFLKALRSADGKEDEAATAKGAGGDTMDLHDRTNGHAEVDNGPRGDEGGDSEPSTCDLGKLSLETPEHPPLSSSLEAEQRLLREMGWKDEASDDDTYAPLTEEELREFQNLTKLRQEKLQQQQQPQRNGIQRPTALPERPALWSPRRATNLATPLGNGCSSSSSSSDTESDSN